MNASPQESKKPIEFIPDGDPAIDDIRRARFMISKRFGHDINRLCEYLMQRQEEYPDRLIGPPREEPNSKPDDV